MTLLSVMSVPCRDQMEMRVVVRNDLIEASIDNVWQTWVPETAIISGQPGVGMRQAPAGNSISLVELGPLDRTPPNPVPLQAIAMTAYPNAIEMQWQAPPDDPNGTGVVRYDVVRHGLYHRGYWATHFTDESVQPSSSYTFTVYAIDHHFNYSAPTTFTVTTPPVGTVNPRQIGVRNTAAHWGGGGEQINVNSGNLNFKLPLLEAKGRNGQSLALGLSYNSQLWRKDDSGIWKYDSCACSQFGKVKRVSNPYAPGGPVYWTTYTYDGRGRTLSVSHPGNSGATTYVYEGNTVKVTDPAGKWKKFTNDAMGNLVKVEEPRPGGGLYETFYAYDFLDRLTRVTMPRDGTTQSRSWTYNAQQRLESTTHPESGATSYTYNPDGSLLRKTDAKGQKVEYGYDLFGRVLWTDRYKAGSATPDPCQSVSFV